MLREQLGKMGSKDELKKEVLSQKMRYDKGQHQNTVYYKQCYHILILKSKHQSFSD